MAISSNDIVFVYSGGLNNFNPSKSIGGNPSINSIETISNSLFGNISDRQNFVDYRCFYIFNNSETETLYNCNIYLRNKIESISSSQLGIAQQTDVQLINFNISPSFGNFTLGYEGNNTIPITWDSNPNIFAKNIQNALNNFDLLSGVFVEINNNTSYKISFLQKDNNRNHDVLEVASNNLSPSTVINISKISQGQPINSIPSLLPTSTTRPFNVVFYETNQNNKLFIGNLRPNDGVPVWIKRTKTGIVENDEINGFDFFISGNINEETTEATNSTQARPCFYYE